MKKIAWLIPTPIKGSGGILTIFNHLNALSSQGYECHAHIGRSKNINSVEIAKEMVEKYFGKVNATFYLGFDVDEEIDMAIATAWFSAKHVKRIQQKCKKAYFIQDYEAYFNSVGDFYLTAENSYNYGFYPITMGRWLSHKMITTHNQKSNFINLCADLNVYKEIHKIEKEKAICFIYQPEKPRRCSQIGLDALKIVKDAIPDLKIYLYGSRKNPNKKVDFEHKNLGLISIKKCNELYNRCIAGLCISSTNPSRIPFEMMAAGLPVVEIYRENTIYDFPQDAMLLADQTPEAIAKAIIQLINDQALREKMSKAGIEFMMDKSLESGYAKFTQLIDSIFRDNYDGAGNIQPMYLPLPVK